MVTADAKIFAEEWNLLVKIWTYSFWERKVAGISKVVWGRIGFNSLYNKSILNKE